MWSLFEERVHVDPEANQLILLDVVLPDQVVVD